MEQKQKILPGTPEWDAVCHMCGLCCLVKTINEYGRVCLTRVRCSQLDIKTHKCRCYSSDVHERTNDQGFDCFKNGGSPLNLDSLHNDYVVPGFCPYVKKFVGPNKLVYPEIDWENTISENELKPGEKLQDYIIPGSSQYFRYNNNNPVLNKKLGDLFTK